jgi:Short C-terminal domain
MGVKSSVNIVAPINIEKCFSLLKEVGATVDAYKLVDASPSTHSIVWRKGMGWTNPIRVRADLMPMGPAQTQVTLSAEIAAVFDPFNFATNAIELFERPFKEGISKLKLPGETIPTSITSAQTSVADEIRKLADLKAEGIISEDEFIKKKTKLLES